MQTQPTTATLFTVTCNDEVLSNVSGPDVMRACDRLFRAHGTRPSVIKQPVEASTTTAKRAVPTATKDVSPEGKARSEHDAGILQASGFAIAQPMFDRGTLVNKTGVSNAWRSRQEYEALPLTTDACVSLRDTVRNERRKDDTVDLSSLSMLDSGRITRGGGRLSLTERAFQQFTGRMSSSLTSHGLPGLGGAGSYLRVCPPALRAHNVNHWIAELSQVEVEDPQNKNLVTLRHRRGDGGREVYSVVSPSYTGYDADQIAEAVLCSVPGSARGRVTYDGHRTRIEALFHTTVQPEHFVVGEFFRAGVIVRTDDTGGGSIVVQAAVWQNLCLNLIIVDRSAQEVCRVRHVGNTDRLADAFRSGFDAAIGKIDHFVHAWDEACEDKIEAPESMKLMDGAELRKALMEASIRGILERDLVPVVGKKTDAVPVIRRLWEEDDSGAGRTHAGLNRAGLTNAFTRYAHEVAAQSNPWVEDEIQEAAGRLLWGTGQFRRIPVSVSAS